MITNLPIKVSICYLYQFSYLIWRFYTEETSRIVSAGGFVEYGRVNGNLALSRAIGDFEFKNNHGLPPEDQIVTANPDILVHELGEEDEFLILACDGGYPLALRRGCVADENIFPDRNLGLCHVATMR